MAAPAQALSAQRLQTLLDQGLHEGIFEAAALGVVNREGWVWTAGNAANRRWFDLASLTKPLATATTILALHETAKLDVDAPIATHFAQPPPAADRITPRMLLTHRAGLVPFRRWFEHADPTQPNPADLQARILGERPQQPPDTVTQYSDTGYIWLAALAEAVTDKPLADCWRSLIAAPLRWDALRWGPLPETDTVPTGRCAWRNRPLHGEIHDATAAILGPRAGHAGLFGTLPGVLKAAAAWLRGIQSGWPTVSAQTLSAACRLPPHAGQRPLAWDRVTPGTSQAGTRAPGDAVGHLGFTGTSLWLAPHDGIAVALLTNRVTHDPSGKRFRRWRPKLHDAVWAATSGGRLPAAPKERLRLD